MMKTVITGLALLAVATSAHDVKVLDNTNFTDTVTNDKITLVKFYAPWCGHCKKIAPEFETASIELSKEEITLAEVDCTEDDAKDSCTKYGVRGYPTLKVFRKGVDEPSDYEGGRDATGIMSYMRKQTQPAFTVCADDEALKKMTDADNTVVAFMAAEEGDDFDTFTTLANNLRNDFNFAVVTDAELTKAEGASAGSVVFYRQFDEPKLVMDTAITADNIEKFIQDNSMPLFGEIGPDNYSKYMAKGLPIAWSFLDYPTTEEADAMMAGIAKEFQGKLSFVKLDGEKWAQHGKGMGITTTPGFVIQQDRKNFLFGGEWSAEALTAHAGGMLDGSIKAHMKSEEIPDQDPDEAVVTVVGKNFDQVVFDNAKDVLVEFYAPWCGHCKSLAPKFEALAQEFKDTPSVVIAKVDATENDTPIDVSGFPTLFFFPADDNHDGLKYEGGRTQEDMSKYIKENAKSDLTAKTEGHDEL